MRVRHSTHGCSLSSPDGRYSHNNIEEFLNSEWFSDPYRKDIFVEMDIMGDGPNGEKTYFPENSKELIMTALDKQNIIYHLDMGDMGGYEVIPFADDLSRNDLIQIYNTYFYMAIKTTGDEVHSIMD